MSDNSWIVEPHEKIRTWIIELDHRVMHEVDIYSENERWKRLSVYRLPASIIKLNRNAYTPQVVSFGPCYHGHANLKPMEEHKDRALLHFLRRSRKPIMVYIECLNIVVDDLRAAYQSLDNHWREDTERFLQLMILDGCFMLEILRIFTRSMEGYAESDPIFSNHGIVYVMPDIMRDMLMIENQLPMLVLHRLVAAEGASNTQVSSLGLILLCTNKLAYPKGSTNLFQITIILQSIKDYVNKLLFRLYNLDSYSRHIWFTKTIPSATELHEAGIQIQRSRSTSLQDIRFYKGVFCVTLKIPVIVVDNITETFFLNLLAFERLHVGAGREVTNYLPFMNNIIRDSKDISLLRSCGIIQNSLGKDEVVADLFNSLTRDTTIDPDSSVYIVEKKVIKYCSRPWVRWRANLVRTYFKNPWASISVIGSMFLFAFTFAQTGYTVIAYYRRP
ncbi:unnamed protein product [Coffea canephora]|uniref:Uncharacterized protein n=1 Tax=Coffea canephora TaxID=49390 RepID=A0A068UD53_COFCA|nr:unnamed protein product [Coffea canephora]